MLLEINKTKKNQTYSLYQCYSSLLGRNNSDGCYDYEVVNDMCIITYRFNLHLKSRKITIFGKQYMQISNNNDVLMKSIWKLHS